jgi:hypothetical protein
VFGLSICTDVSLYYEAHHQVINVIEFIFEVRLFYTTQDDGFPSNAGKNEL